MNTVLLSVFQQGNRHLLKEWLELHYEVIESDLSEAPEKPFDLCIVDAVTLSRSEYVLQGFKDRQAPLFAPILLVTQRQDVGFATRQLWKLVDEIIISPIEKIELQARVHSLLLARQLSLDLHKKDEELLHQSEERYRQIFEHSLDAILLTTPDGRVFAANPSACAMLGWWEDDLRNQRREAFMDTSDPRLTAALEQHAQTGRFQGELTLLRRGVEKFPAEVSATRFPSHQGEVCTSMIIRDITERKRAEERNHLQIKRLSALKDIDHAITSSFDLKFNLDLLLRHVIHDLEADAADVLKFDQTLSTLEYVTGTGFFRRDWQQSPRSVRDTDLAGRCVMERQIIHIEQLANANLTPRQVDLLQREDVCACWIVPLIAKGKVKGVLEVFDRTITKHDSAWREYLTTLAGQAAIAIDNVEMFTDLQYRNFELTAAYEAAIEGWSRALDLRDKETEGHTKRVADIAVNLAISMGVNEADLVNIRYGALLHDIGQMGVPDQILLKPQALTDEEWEIVRQHPQIAYDLLYSIKFLQPATDIPYCHHEKWDGSGYPRGLKGEQIPLAARICTVADVWDALTSNRPFRPAWPPERALEHIRSLSGSHFDPNVVAAFLKLQPAQSVN